MKACNTCRIDLPLAAFCKDRYRKDGLCVTCRECRRLYERRNAATRKVKKATYYLQNKARIDARNSRWQRDNPEARRRLSREHYRRDPQRELDRNKRWRNANPDVYKRGLAKRIAARDKAEAAASVKRWRLRHPEDARAMVATHRAKRKRAIGSFTGAEILALFDRQRGKCAICVRALPVSYHKDHILPLKLGGSNFISNIQLLCQRCNSCKGARHPVAFMQSRGFLL